MMTLHTRITPHGFATRVDIDACQIINCAAATVAVPEKDFCWGSERVPASYSSSKSSWGGVIENQDGFRNDDWPSSR